MLSSSSLPPLTSVSPLMTSGQVFQHCPPSCCSLPQQEPSALPWHLGGSRRARLWPDARGHLSGPHIKGSSGGAFLEEGFSSRGLGCVHASGCVRCLVRLGRHQACSWPSWDGAVGPSEPPPAPETQHPEGEMLTCHVGLRNLDWLWAWQKGVE